MEHLARQQVEGTQALAQAYSNARAQTFRQACPVPCTRAPPSATPPLLRACFCGVERGARGHPLPRLARSASACSLVCFPCRLTGVQPPTAVHTSHLSRACPTPPGAGVQPPAAMLQRTQRRRRGRAAAVRQALGAGPAAGQVHAVGAPRAALLVRGGAAGSVSVLVFEVGRKGLLVLDRLLVKLTQSGHRVLLFWCAPACALSRARAHCTCDARTHELAAFPPAAPRPGAAASMHVVRSTRKRRTARRRQARRSPPCLVSLTSLAPSCAQHHDQAALPCTPCAEGQPHLSLAPCCRYFPRSLVCAAP